MTTTVLAAGVLAVIIFGLSTKRRTLEALLKRAGLPDVRLYDLRHTFATLWLESGEHPKILQEILDHSRISVTRDTYSHVVPHMQREAMGRFGERFTAPS